MSDEINLSKTSLKQEWKMFCLVMIILWVLVAKVSIFLLLLMKRNATPQAKWMLLLNVFIGSLRVAMFVDPRGWKDVYPVVVQDLLLRIGTCVLFAQWTIVIGSWWALGFLGKLTIVRETQAKISILVLVIALTFSVVLLTVLTEVTGNQSLSSASNSVLGIYAILFTIFGIFSGVRAIKSLGSVMRGSRIALTQRLTTSLAKKIRLCLVVVPSLSLLAIVVSVIRGRTTLNQNQFFGYLVVRSVCELGMCFMAMLPFSKAADYTTSSRLQLRPN